MARGRFVRSSRVKIMDGVYANIGGGLFPRYTSTTVRVAKGVSWNSRKNSVSIALGKGLKYVLTLGRSKG